jgi:glycosyltransferase involved in cell wall biosynthesis
MNIHQTNIQNLGNKISCCLLTFNHVHIVESTINSILQQSVKNFEFIISDDCSTDGTWEKILAIKKKFNHIKAIQTPKNLKMAGNCNFAVSHTSRPYIAILHHDDLFKKELLEEWAKKLELYPKTGFVFNSYENFHTKKITSLMSKDYFDGDFFLQNYLLKNFDCQVWGSAMIRKTSWIKVNGMNEKFKHLADVDLWIRLSKYFDVSYVAKPLIIIRQLRPNYYPHEYTGSVWKNKRIIYEIHAENIKNYMKIKKVYKFFLWYRFLLKLNFENLKWIIYALIKKKKNMIYFSEDVATDYDFYIFKKIRVLSRLLIKFI